MFKLEIMEYQSRRNRRGRERRTRQFIAPQSFTVTSSPKSWSIMDSVCSFFIMTSLLAIIYLMLDYHCTVCSPKCDLTNITMNIDDIATNISLMKESYSELETKIIKFSHELPKIEGQLELLESLAKSIGSGDFHSPKEYIPQNKMNITLKKPFHVTSFTNVTKKFPKMYIKPDQD